MSNKENQQFYPPAAVFRCNAGINSQETTDQESSSTINKKLDSLQIITERLERQQESLIAQNKELMRALGENTALLKQVLKQDKISEEFHLKFPVKNKEELVALENEIEENENYFVTIVKKLLQPGGISKNLNRILSDSIIWSHNFDGIRNKDSFKENKNLCGVLYKAMCREGYCYQQFVLDIKHGFKLHKNRLSKADCVARKEPKM